MSFKPLILHEGKGLNPVLKKGVRFYLERNGMKEEYIRAYLDGADSARDALVDDVRSAVEGLKDVRYYVAEDGQLCHSCNKERFTFAVSDINWKPNSQVCAWCWINKWFPVFSQSLSEDAKINDGCSQQVTSAPSSEAKSSVSHHVSMGAATVSVATILEIIDLMASIDDNNQVWGHDTNLGDIDVLVDKIQKILSLSQPSGVEAPSVASEVSQQRKRVDGEKTLDFFEEKHGVPAGEFKTESTSANGKDNTPKHAPGNGDCICKHGSGAITKTFVEQNGLCSCECHKVKE